MGAWYYSYDAMNRLTGATASSGTDDGMTLSWTYDRYGNRWSQTATGTRSGSAPQPQLTFYCSNGVNTYRIYGWSYDAAGKSYPKVGEMNRRFVRSDSRCLSGPGLTPQNETSV